MQRIRTLLVLVTPWLAVRAEQRMALPDWLAMLPGASSIAGTASSSSLDLSYHDSLALAEATERLEQQMEKAGVRFSTSFDGIGNSISASTDSVSCIVHIADADSGSRVRIGCAPGIARPSSPVIAPSVPSPAVAAPPVVSTPAIPAHTVAEAPVSAPPVAAVPKPAAPARPAPANPIGTEIEGWSQARWGMTQSQLLKAFPGEAKLLTGDLTGRRFGSRGIATVEISGADIGGIPVRLLFFFDSAGKLDGIRFVTDLPSPSDEQFKKMETAMEGVYKTPSLRAAMGQSALNTAWLLPNSVVELAYVRTELLNLCIDRRSHQTKETVRASWPGFTEVRGTGQL